MPLWSSLPSATPADPATLFVVAQSGIFGLLDINDLGAALVNQANTFTAGPQAFDSPSNGTSMVRVRRKGPADTGELLAVATAVGEGDGALFYVTGLKVSSALPIECGAYVQTSTFKTDIVIFTIGASPTPACLKTGANNWELRTFNFTGSGWSPFWCGANVATDPAAVVIGASGQTANLHQWRDSSNNVLTAIDANGGIVPASMADGTAANNTLYYSTTAGKLVYKDGAGVVNNLY